jgi:uncharacterized membrane protein
MKKSLLFVLLSVAAATSACGHSDGGAVTGAVCPTPSTLTYVNFGKAFMTKYCVECHDAAKTGAARKGAPEFHDFDTQLGIKQVADHVDEYAGSGPSATNEIMPEAGSRPIPTLAERKQLSEWIACQLP